VKASNINCSSFRPVVNPWMEGIFFSARWYLLTRSTTHNCQAGPTDAVAYSIAQGLTGDGILERRQRQTRQHSHTVLLKAVCHLVQEVQSEHVQADLQKKKKERTVFGWREGEREREAKDRTIRCSNSNGVALSTDSFR
jgi:hypothetical protein